MNKKAIFTWIFIACIVLTFWFFGLLKNLAINQVGPRSDESPTIAIPWSHTEEQEITKITKLAQTQGVKAAFNYLKQTWGATPVKAHLLAHTIGQLAYKQLGDKGFAICDQSFAFGCYHGLIMALMKDQGEKGLTIVRQACLSLPTSVEQTGCFHGTGHGMMEWKGDIPSALTQCRKLGSAEDGNCFDGVYMDYDMDAMNYFPHTAIATNTPWAFCDTAPSDSYPWCIRNHTFLLLATHNIPPNTTIRDCLQLKGMSRSMCESSVGIFSADNKQLSVSYVQDRCGLLNNTDDISYCIVNAIKELLFDSNPARSAIAKQLCSGLTAGWLQQCIHLIVK